MPWSVIVPAAASLIGGAMGSDASRSAAATGAAATDRATAAQERMFDKQAELQKPFREAGVAGLNRLQYLLGLGAGGGLADLNTWARQAGYDMPVGRDWTSQEMANLTPEYNKYLAKEGAKDSEFGSLLSDFSMADFEADPGYAFRKSEGMKGLENSAAARGGLLSGAALKAIQKYGQDLASQEYGNAYGRFAANQTNKYNKLAGLVNTGQGAANTLTNAAGNLGNAMAGNITAAGNAQAAGQVGSANAWSNALGGISNLYQQNELMKMIRNPSSGGFGTGTGYGNRDYGLYF